MPDAPESKPVSNNLQAWLSQGEQLYNAALAEFHALESQLEELEQKLAAKQTEVNQIAQIINKPPVEQRRHSVLQAEVIDDHPAVQRLPVPATPAAAAAAAAPTNSSNATIARALTGKFGR
jgi:hypothetical protein